MIRTFWDSSFFCFQRDPAEEALKSNNMNLDQAMSALLEKKTELDKRGMGIAGHDYNNGLINKPMSCPRPPLLSKDPSADPRLPFMDKVSHSIVNPYLNTLCMCSIKFPADDSRVSKCFLGFLRVVVHHTWAGLMMLKSHKCKSSPLKQGHFSRVNAKENDRHVLFSAGAEWNVWRWWSSTSPGHAAAASSATSAASQLLSA